MTLKMIKSFLLWKKQWRFMRKNYKILADLQGQARSIISKQSIAQDGAPIPWYSYPAIEYFRHLDVNGLDLFEFGCGISSLIWSAKGANVWCVERDPEWHAAIQAKGEKIREIAFRESRDEYADAIFAPGIAFDVVIIDGAWRNECAATALRCLKPGGVIILDNSDWYTDASQTLRGKGFLQIDFSGFGPCNRYCWTTSLLFRADNPILATAPGHPTPIGGITIDEKGATW